MDVGCVTKSVIGNMNKGNVDEDSSKFSEHRKSCDKCCACVSFLYFCTLIKVR